MKNVRGSTISGQTRMPEEIYFPFFKSACKQRVTRTRGPWDGTRLTASSRAYNIVSNLRGNKKAVYNFIIPGLFQLTLEIVFLRSWYSEQVLDVYCSRITISWSHFVTQQAKNDVENKQKCKLTLFKVFSWQIGFLFPSTTSTEKRLRKDRAWLWSFLET